MDIQTFAFLAAQAVAPLADTQPALPVGPVVVERLPRAAAARSAPIDTAFEYSAAYYRRLDIHRIGSYAMLPLFAFQFIAGSQLYDKSFTAPRWAKTGHRVAATGVAVLFASNTITGAMNLYEGRRDPAERRRKIFHAALMLAADAGFTATGILAERAERSGEDRDLHRAVALTSIGLATVSYVSMLDVFRKD